jgi:hypothetical protein
MAERDYETAPVSEQLGIPNIIAGLVSDLDELRAGKISVNDAMARSMIAKQIFNGVRIYLNGARLLADVAPRARPISASLSPQEDNQ